jgi:hypothetical protein
MRTERVKIETHHPACEAIASDGAIPTKDPMRLPASAKAVVSESIAGGAGLAASRAGDAATANARIFE